MATDKIPSSSSPHTQSPISSLKSAVKSKFGQFVKHFPGLHQRRGSYSPLKNDQGPSLTSASQGSLPEGMTHTPLAESVFFSEKEIPGTYAEKRQLAIDAEIAAYAYHRSTDKIAEASNTKITSVTPPQWTPVTDILEDLATQTGLSVDKEKGYLYDKSTGLTAYLLQSPASEEPKEIRLIFGGTTSGKKTGGLAKRFICNGKFTLAQWKSNIQNALGLKIPGNFEQAKELTTRVADSLKGHSQYADSKLILTGHSKGGAEATYAALSQDDPLEARVFSAAELHQKLLDTIPEKNLKQAKELVAVVNIKGDMVPRMRKVLPTNIHPIGNTVTLPPAHAYNVDRHDTFTKHIRFFAERR